MADNSTWFSVPSNGNRAGKRRRQLIYINRVFSFKKKVFSPSPLARSRRFKNAATSAQRVSFPAKPPLFFLYLFIFIPFHYFNIYFFRGLNFYNFLSLGVAILTVIVRVVFERQVRWKKTSMETMMRIRVGLCFRKIAYFIIKFGNFYKFFFMVYVIFVCVEFAEVTN